MIPLIEVRGVRKAYGAVEALAGVSLTIEPGEIHALVGENGAGKSTLIRILAGAVRPDAGEIRAGGEPLPPGAAAASEAAGIATIHQESVAFPFLNAEDNLFVGREPRRAGGLLLDRRRMERDTRALLDRLGEPGIDTKRPVGELSPAARQIIAIARALSRRGRVLILDEPTASLSSRETAALFRILRQLCAEGSGMLYVSHRLDEVFALADRVTVLRDGRRVETRAVADTDRAALIRAMVGRDLPEAAARPDRDGAGGVAAGVVLDVRGLSREGAFSDVTLSVRAGEVVGLGGLVGAGRSEVARAIFGIDRASSGTVAVAGAALPPGSVRAAIGRGVALVPEDRQHQGLVLPLPVQDNLLLVVLRALARGGVLRSRRREEDVTARLLRDLAVRVPAVGAAAAPAEALSGGNQQKLVLGKWLAAAPRVLILDEPTRGVDVGAKAEVYRLIRQLAGGGMATLLISSDLPELLALSDRIVVLRAGRVAGELREPAERTEERVLTLALGGPATTGAGAAA